MLRLCERGTSSMGIGTHQRLVTYSSEYTNRSLTLMRDFVGKGPIYVSIIGVLT